MSITLNGTEGVTLDNGSADGAQVTLKSSGYSDWNLDNYSGRFRAYYNATEYFTINSSGNVGIGTASPIRKLQVSGSSVDQIASVVTNTQSTTNTFIISTGTSFNYGGVVGASSWFYGDRAVAIGNDTNNPIQFITNANERMRIDSSGNVLVGTTDSGATSGVGFKSIASSTVPQFAVVVNQAGSAAGFSLYNTNAGAYRFYADNAGTLHATSTSIAAISDASLKENIVDIEPSLDKVMALKPRRFDWKEEVKVEQKQIQGFIAQELEEVLPDLVYDYQYNDTETKKSIKMGDMIPTLVKAIQEQQELIKALTSRIETLEAK